MVEPDQIDAKIISTLIKDARTTLTDLAKICKISSPAVKKRIEHMKKNKVIVGSTLNFNLVKFGYPLYALVGLKLEQTDAQKIINIVNEHSIVAGIDHTIGHYDLCLFIFSKSVEELDNLKNLLIDEKNVMDVEINVWNKFDINYNNINIENSEA
jgi:Lrp/AsnC family transcriptional regulator for asnA, asnC and gidA